MKRLILLSIYLFFSCVDKDFVPNNPLDPLNPEYIQPFITILSGPEESATVQTSEVTFTYGGNETSMLFRTKFDDNNWSAWENATYTTLDYLDEGAHRFQLQGKYTTGDTSSIEDINFNVNAVTGPALIFYPRRHVTIQGSTVTFEIIAEEVYDLTGMEMVISYNPAQIGVVAVRQGSIFSGFGESVFFSDDEPGAGQLTITCGIWGGEMPSFTGTRTIAEIDVQLKIQGEANLDFDGSELFRDPNNNPIIIQESVNALVQAQ